MPDVAANGTAQAGLDERFRKAATPIAFGSVGFPDCEAGSFEMRHHAWFDNLSRWIDDAANDTGGIELLADDAPGIDTFQVHSIPFTTEPIEVPPREAVLRGYY